MNKRIISLAASLPVGIVAPLLAFAENAPGTIPTTPTSLTSVTNFRLLMCQILGWLFAFFIILVIIFMLLAAYKYLTAGGDPEKVKTASNYLIYAAIAVVVALFAKGLPVLINTFTGGTGSLNAFLCG